MLLIYQECFLISTSVYIFRFVLGMFFLCGTYIRHLLFTFALGNVFCQTLCKKQLYIFLLKCFQHKVKRERIFNVTRLKSCDPHLPTMTKYCSHLSCLLNLNKVDLPILQIILNQHTIFPPLMKTCGSFVYKHSHVAYKKKIVPDGGHI